MTATEEPADDSREKVASHFRTLLVHAAELFTAVRGADPGEIETVSIHVTMKGGAGAAQYRYLCFPHIRGNKELPAAFRARLRDEYLKAAEAHK